MKKNPVGKATKSVARRKKAARPSTTASRKEPKARSSPLPFRSRLFLFRALAGIFLAQFLLILIAIHKCGTVAACPKLGQRVENLFGVATATVLSLLGSSNDLQ